MVDKIIFWTRQIWWKPSYNDFPENEALELLNYAYWRWITTFDTAPIYGNGKSEELLWKIIENNSHLNKNFRSKIKIITKFWIRLWEKKENYFSFKKESIIEELDESLVRLKTDYIDIYLLHIPDNSIDISEVIETLNYLKGIWKIRSYWLCNTYNWLLKDFLNYKGNQIEYIEDFYNLIEKKAENLIFPYIKNKDIKFLSYSPLYRWILTDIWPKILLEKNENAINRLIKHDWLKTIIQKRNMLLEVSKRKNIKLDKLAVDFLSNNKNVDSIIFWTTNKKHLDRFLENYLK
jgi:aryl-alcohol dehydrogenase-like predicted oxidoreductase